MSRFPRLCALARAGVLGMSALLASTAGAQAPVSRTPTPGPPRRTPPALPSVAPQTADVPVDSGPPPLALVDALRTALTLNPALRAARAQVRAGRGAATAAEAPLDARVVTTLADSRTSNLAFAPAAGADVLAAGSVVATRQRVLTYRVGLEKQVQYGAVIAPSVDVAQTGVVGFAGGPANRASAGLNLTVPLARNRLGGAADAARRSAAAAFDAAAADLRQSVAQTAFDASAAYWQYAAAGEQLAAYRRSEARAGVLVDETTELVRADARPAADLRQFRGNLATKRAQRIAAEQSVAEARQQLGLVLGLPAADIAALPPARLYVPAAGATLGAAGGGSLGPAAGDPDRLTAIWATVAAPAALARRPDVRAATARRAAAEQRVRAADHALRPRADLTVGVTYAGLTRGAGFDNFFSPLGRTMPGTSTVVQLQYELPARNLLARGQAEQAEAALEQARIAERDLVRRVESAVAVAAGGVERGRHALAEAGEAVRIALEVVENEKQKFKLGVSTQIDVIYAEDALTNGLLAEIGARRSYAASIGALRLHAGDLAAVDGDPAALAAALTRDPAPAQMPNAVPDAIPAPRRVP